MDLVLREDQPQHSFLNRHAPPLRARDMTADEFWCRCLQWAPW